MKAARPPRPPVPTSPTAAGLPAAALLAVTLALNLTGCAGSLFQSKTPPVHAYLLSADLRSALPQGSDAGAGAGDAGTPRIAVRLAVQRPRVRSGLDTDRIAVLYPDRRLDYFADARWSGPLDRMVQDLALQAFHTGARGGDVTDESSAFPAGYWLEIEVADFQAEYASLGMPPTVHVRLRARLGAADDRRVLGTFDAELRETADNRLSAIVGAYERAAAGALGQLVTDTSRVLAQASTAPAPMAGR